MTTTRTRTARRLARGALLGAGLTLAGAVFAASPTDAAPRTKSAAVASAADDAVAALDRWQATERPIDYVLFVRHREVAAELAETELALPAGSLRDAWEAVSVAQQQAVLGAVSQLGVPYRYLASEPGVGFDCSGLLIWAYGGAGVDLPRVSRDQIRATEEVDGDHAAAGDLVYYPGHISMYIGAGMVVHAPNSGSHVEITDLPDRSLRFGAVVGEPDAPVDEPSLVDGALAVAE